jgi:hypothetical protein
LREKEDLVSTQQQKRNTLKSAVLSTATGYSTSAKSRKKAEGRHVCVKTFFIRKTLWSFRINNDIISKKLCGAPLYY